MLFEHERCGHCRAPRGELHAPGCWIEQCPYCGWLLSVCACGRTPSEGERLPWAGKFPGAAECQEFGWYCQGAPPGEDGARCAADDPRATEDLKRLFKDARWDPARKRFVLPAAPAPSEPAPERSEGSS